MKKVVIIAIFLFVMAVADVFTQTDDIRVLEAFNNFAEIKETFQRRVHDASLEYKYFYHDESPFDVENGAESELFNKKAKKIISKNKYFIFELSSGSVYFLFLANKDDAKAIAFFFMDDLLVDATQCSDVEINEALASYLGL